jgi:hypothetical protein
VWWRDKQGIRKIGVLRVKGEKLREEKKFEIGVLREEGSNLRGDKGGEKREKKSRVAKFRLEMAKVSTFWHC